MTYFPEYLKTYPNMNSASPLHISLNRLPRGFRAHRHDFLEFSYVIGGEGSESINGVRHEMLPGTFTFVLPYQVHELFTAPGSTLVLFNCMFAMELLTEAGRQEALLSLIDRSGASPYIQLHGPEQDAMKNLVEDMHREFGGSEPWRQTMLQLKLKEILIAFDRARARSLPPRSEEELRVGASAGAGTGTTARGASVWAIIHYIHRNYQEDLTLSGLANRFALSVSRISEVIKETTGQNFLHFLHDLRIRHACGLLVSTEMSVAEIALEVGYGSYSTFARVFHDTKGMVPKEYRKRKTQGG